MLGEPPALHAHLFGSHEQISGVIEQVRGRHLSD
jgi:hypothetical protein